VSNESTGLDAKGSARRKLIRGSFAVPAVLTLHNGGAIAATSINNSLKRQNNNPMTKYASNSDDIWFRYQLWGWVKNGAVKYDDGLWIKGSDLAVYRVQGNSVWLSSNRVQRFNLQANSLDWDQKYSVPRGTDGAELKRVSHWVSLRVDRYGNLTGAGSTGMGSAVSDSCWNSFAAGMQL